MRSLRRWMCVVCSLGLFVVVVCENDGMKRICGVSVKSDEESWSESRERLRLAVGRIGATW